MEIETQRPTTICTHCEREILALNIDLHYAHCSRNLERCDICSDMIPRKHAKDHYDDCHAPVDCSMCSERVQREVFDIHKDERCPQRIVTCEYCEFPLPAVDLSKHQEVCGNRTEYCNTCNIYVRLRERLTHNFQFHESLPSNNEAESSRNGSMRGPQHRRQGQGDPSNRRLLVTIAVTGIAVLIGSIFFQKS